MAEHCGPSVDQQNQILETLLLAVLSSGKDTTWDTAQKALQDIDPSYAKPHMLLAFYQIYTESDKIARLRTMSDAEREKLKQDMLCSLTLCEYLATKASRAELQGFTDRMIDQCPIQCSSLVIRRHIVTRWPELKRSEFQHVLKTFNEILEDPATQRKIAEHNSKIKSAR